MSDVNQISNDEYAPLFSAIHWLLLQYASHFHIFIESDKLYCSVSVDSEGITHFNTIVWYDKDYFRNRNLSEDFEKMAYILNRYIYYGDDSCLNSISEPLIPHENPVYACHKPLFVDYIKIHSDDYLFIDIISPYNMNAAMHIRRKFYVENKTPAMQTLLSALPYFDLCMGDDTRYFRGGKAPAELEQKHSQEAKDYIQRLWDSERTLGGYEEPQL